MNLFRIILKHTVFFSIVIPIITLANNSLSSSNSPSNSSSNSPSMTNTLLANNNPSLLTDRHYSVGLNLGVAIPTSLVNSTTFPLGYSTFSYSSNTNEASAIIAGISISKIVILTPLYTLQVGLSANSLANMDVKGNLEQGVSRPFYQANYSYSINSYQYLADAKLRYSFDHHYFPYIYLGMGIASNKAYNYSTSVPDYLTVTPDYSDKTTNSFTYGLGFGVDYFVVPQFSIGFGYRFTDLGQAGLGSGVIRNTHVSSKLTQSNLYTNTLLAQLNYFI